MLPALLRDIQPVARNLSNPETGLKTFFNELGDAARIVAPAAETQADLFVNLDTTFTALNGVAKPYIQDSITEGVPALDAAIESFPIQRPFLRNTEGLFHELRPGVKALSTAAPDLADALEFGTPTLLRTPAFNRRLASLLQELQTFANDPVAPRGVKRLAETLETLKPPLDYLAPAQLTCNYLTLWFRNVSSLLSEGDVHGTWQRFIIIATPQGPNNEGGPSNAPANGPTSDNYLHSNPYPNTASPGQPKECESGNEPYPVGRKVIGNPRRQAARRHGGHQVMAASRQRRRRNRSPLHGRGDRARDHRSSASGSASRRTSPSRTASASRPTFASANSLRLNSPVRIAGVAVGKVKKVEAKEGTDEAVVTLELKKSALPIHEDATAKIRPRIFLEGNFFVDLQPGTPSSPKLADGDVIKVTRTATPVQLDQVLTSLQSDTREDLRDLLDGFAVGLNSKPSAADDRDADKSARGQTAAESLNDAYRDSPGALKGTAQVNEALLGTEPDRDVARLLDGRGEDDRRADPQRGPAQGPDHELQHDDGGLRERGRQPLRLDPPARADARERQRRARLAQRRRSRRRAPSPARSCPACARRRHDPGVVPVGRPGHEADVQGGAAAASPRTSRRRRRTSRTLTNASLTLLPQIDRTALCARDTVLPTGDLMIHDQFDTGTENYKEFWWTMVGLAGESQNFDGNGPMVRFAPGGGSQAVALGHARNSPSGQLIGAASAPVIGTPAEVPRQAPAVQRQRALPQEQDPRRQRRPGPAIGPGENAP